MSNSNLLLILIKPIIAEITLILASLIILLIGAFNKLAKKHINLIAILTLLIVSLILINYSDQSINNPYFNNFFINSRFTELIKLIIVIGTIGILILNHNNPIDDNTQNYEFTIILLFSLLGMMIMIMANNFLVLYMGLELQSLCFYVLVAYNRNCQKSAEAGLKYFILSALASGILLYGISLIYGFTASINFTDLANYFLINNVPIALLVGMIMIIVALCFKLAAAPFHFWSPDVYEGAPIITTSYLVAIPKIVILAVVGKLLIGCFGLWHTKWQQIIYLISSLSLLVGAIGALNQNKIKRLIAYSSINHIGYLLIGIVSYNKSGISAALIYAIAYLTMNIGMFAAILSISNFNKLIDDIRLLSGLGKTQPLIAFSITILLLSMAGIPPLAGFFTKFAILDAAAKENLYSLIIIGIISSIISAFYYLRIIKIMYFDSAEPHQMLINNSTKSLSLIMSLFNLFFILFYSIIYQNVSKSVDTLF